MKTGIENLAGPKIAAAKRPTEERRAMDRGKKKSPPRVSLLGAESTWIVSNIGCLLTMDPQRGEGSMGLLRDAAVAIRNERIVWVGTEKNLPDEYRSVDDLDAGGALVTPGMIDSHTHLVFAGSRSDEFFSRLSGETYETIAKKGGGISKTVSATRKASEQDLVALARKRLDRFLSFGVTTVEAKSGYGLSLDDELRLLEVSSSLGHDVDVVPTFLGAHVIPTEYRENRSKYVDLVIHEMLPAVRERDLSQICDVFCDETAFTVEESRKILTAAKEMGFDLKVHADQLSHTGGAELAAELQALSADHLEQVSDGGVKSLAKAGVAGVLLPGAVLFLGKKTYPPVRKLLDAGVSVAISTDFNPGTSYTENLPIMMTVAATELRMTLEEIWMSVTVNAAKATGLGDRGVIALGSLADLVIWDADAPEDVPYQFGCPRIRTVIKRGGSILG